MNQALLKNIDATLGWLLCKILGTTRTDPIVDIPSDIQKILLVRPGGIGDMIILIPIIRAIQERFPDASLDIACQKRNLSVLKLCGMERQALTFDSNPFGFLSHIRKQPYDITIDTEQFHHFSAVFALLSKSPIRIGFKINPRRNPLYTHLINYALDEPEGEQFARLLEPLGIEPASYKLKGALANLDCKLPDGLKRDNPYAVIHPCSSSPYKRWRPQHFVEVIKKLHSESNLSAVIVGDNNDVDMCSYIETEARTADLEAQSYAGKLDLESTAALIKDSRVFIGADSGLSHLAIALDRPSVTLFGPSDHLKWGFESENNAIVRKTLPCAPCFIFGYHKPCRTKECMKKITVADVLEACRKVMRETA